MSYYDDYERWKRSSTNAPAVRGAVTDLDIRTGQRASTDERQRAIHHVEASLKDGRLSGTEAGKRVKAITGAATIREVNEVLADLPNYTEPKKWDWDEHNGLFYSLMAGLVAVFGSMIVVGGVILDHTMSAVNECLISPMVVIGIIGVISVVISSIAHAE